MPEAIILRKLESLRRCVERIEAKRPDSMEELSTNVDIQDILSVNLERAVQLCVDAGSHLLVSKQQAVPETMGAVFTQLAELGILDSDLAQSLGKAVGFRNLSVHAYHDIDWARVFAIVHERMDDFREFAKALALV